MIAINRFIIIFSKIFNLIFRKWWRHMEIYNWFSKKSYYHFLKTCKVFPLMLHKPIQSDNSNNQVLGHACSLLLTDNFRGINIKRSNIKLPEWDNHKLSLKFLKNGMLWVLNKKWNLHMIFANTGNCVILV